MGKPTPTLSSHQTKNNHDVGLKPCSFDVNEWVWRWYPPAAGLKLGLGWTGPYLVVGKISKLTYSIQKRPDSPIVNVHVDHLAPYHGNNAPESWLRVDITEDQSLDITQISHNDSEIEPIHQEPNKSLCRPHLLLNHGQ